VIRRQRRRASMRCFSSTKRSKGTESVSSTPKTAVGLGAARLLLLQNLDGRWYFNVADYFCGPPSPLNTGNSLQLRRRRWRSPHENLFIGKSEDDARQHHASSSRRHAGCSGRYSRPSGPTVQGHELGIRRTPPGVSVSPRMRGDEKFAIGLGSSTWANALVSDAAVLRVAPTSPYARRDGGEEVRRRCPPRRTGRAGVAHRADVTRLATLPRLSGLVKELRMMEIRLVTSLLALATAFWPAALASTTKVE
jgi:hypothetical protein